MIQNSFSSLLLKIFLLFLVLIYFSATSSAQAQCLPPEATVLSGSCDSCFMAVVQVSDPNDPVNGVLNLEFTSFRGDGGSGGIPVTGIPSVVIGAATLSINVGNVNNFGTVQITITNRCCETTGVSLTNFSRSNKTNSIVSKGNIRGQVKYIGNTCQAPKIESVLLENLDGSALELNPPLNNEITVNNKKYGGGLRFFPDATSSDPISPDSQPKRAIKVTAKVTPMQANVPIYFLSFDVDDSSGLFNNIANTGQDNQEALVRLNGFPKEGFFTGFPNGTPALVMTETDGRASVEFNVTMQPGDNFKIVATTNQSLVINPGLLTISGQQILNSTNNNLPLPKQPDMTEPSINPAETITSQLLTVWRKLHVEVDSMSAPPMPPAGDTDPQRNYIKGDISAININANNVQFFFVNQILRDGSKDIDFPGNMGFGRFQGGQLVIGSNTITINNITGNGGQFIAKSTITQIPCQLVNTRGNTSQAFIEQMIPGSTRPTTSNVFILSQQVSAPGQYTGGQLIVAGKTFVISTITNKDVVLDNRITQPPFSLPFFLIDDDQMTAPTLSNMNHFSLMQDSDLPNDNRFAKAYIKPIYDLVNTPNPPPFMKNLPTPNMSGMNLIQQLQSGREQTSTSSLDYWTAYFQGAFQTDDTEDLDPDIEPPSLGQTPFDRLTLGRFNYGCLIYFEACRDYSSVCISAKFPAVTEQRTLATTVLHEAGHLFDLPENSGLIMTGSTPCSDPGWVNLSFAIFSDTHLKMIRSTRNP